MNIIIISVDKIWGAELSRDLALDLNYEYINAEKQFHSLIIGTRDFPIKKSIEEMLEVEHNLLESLINKQDVVIFIPMEMYIAEDNYKLLSTSYTLLIKNCSDDRLDKNLETLASKYTKMVLEKTDATTEKIKKIIF